VNGKSVLIMAGGTGGHVFPGLAVARELIARGVAVAWLGTQRGIEARAVPASELPIDMEWLSIRGVRGNGVLGWIKFPFSLAAAMWHAYGVMRRRKPGLVLSFGGFVAGPGGLVAWLTRTPLVVHEANAIPGFTNKWLAKFARRVLTGFPVGFSAALRPRHVGNPVRREIAALPEPQARFADRRGRLRVLVIGGSLGARVFNQVIPEAIRLMSPDAQPEMRHQCGRQHLEATTAAYAGAQHVTVSEFIDDMAQAYAWADLVIARAGAMTVAELSVAGCGSLLVPLPHAVDDHQTVNARYLVSRHAALLVPQPEFTPARAAQVLSDLCADRARVLQMAIAARESLHANAVNAVVDVCQEVLRA
jgi:UDP-N-acetylglucosamine--N-acetylmuramyl-(pentapeptide) pyrophosphoryl-undecaprenol N-acetylglucosamine transferase